MFIRFRIYQFLKAFTYSTTWALLLVGFFLGVLSALLAPGPGQLAERQPSGWQQAFFEALLKSSGEIDGGGVDEADEAAKLADRRSSTQYEVVAGDSLWKIAKTELGDGALYGVIASLNQLDNPRLIEVGQVLQLPVVDESDGEAPPSDQGWYQVKAGDSLSAIAARELGDESLWPSLYVDNQVTIGHNANLIYPGQWLLVDQNISEESIFGDKKD